MKITNAHIIALSNQKNIQNITTHKVSVDHSYKVVKFKQQFNKFQKAYDESHKAILEEVGITDEQEFNKKLKALRDNKNRDKDQEKEFKTLSEQEKRLNGMTSKLLQEEVKFKDVKALPYKEWKVLQDENSPADGDRKTEMLSGIIMVIVEIKEDGTIKFEGEDTESLLEGILWNAPEEEGSKA